MPRRVVVLLTIAAGAASCPAPAAAAPVLVLEPSGRVTVHQDAGIGPAAPTPGGRRIAHAARGPATKRTVRSELARLYRAHTISRSTYHRYLGGVQAALRAVAGLRGLRRSELAAVLANLHDIAASGRLTPSRLPALFLTLDRNRRWWTAGTLLASGQRVGFAGSEVVWEYYPGQGIELQELGSFGKADGLYEAGRSHYARLAHLLAELIPLAAHRGGGLAWEYYFSFDGGTPPWTSAMSQATALEALTHAYEVFHRRSYLDVARRALGIFHRAPPVGVTVHTRRGSRYLLYSFTPRTAVINGFLWTLVGLYDYAGASDSADARRLFAAGDAEARAELPRYDTGSWSLYQPGIKDTIEYHVLVTGFLHDLCGRTKIPIYCITARHFDAYLKNPPRSP